MRAILDATFHPDMGLSRKLGLLGLRNRALFVCLWRSGLRIHEALLLRPDDLDFEHCTVTVRRGKGGKRRIVGIDRHALTEINAWLHIRALLGLGLDEPVFCVIEGDRRGAPLNQSYVRTRLHHAARVAGVLTRTAPHQLRHSCAVELARAGTPVPLISMQLGHSNVATTATYLQGISPEEVIAVMAGRTW